ncbi:hypothetical protein [Comamonas composti]|uniref:hypothetical protein n=1 Tax=Comamonas composti TaxID=408558 RepID=UPI00041BF6EF|nr:hypothetical protein [Comamonas composti]
MIDRQPQQEPLASLPKHKLRALDVDFTRVLEDLIDALLANGSLRPTDLPLPALNKLQQRKHERQRLQNALDPLDDDLPLI